MHYISLKFLLTAAFIFWPRCTYGFGIQEKADAVSGFWCISVRFCGFRTPLTPPSIIDDCDGDDVNDDDDLQNKIEFYQICLSFI